MMNQVQIEQYLKTTLAALDALRYRKLGAVKDIRWKAYEYRCDPDPQESAAEWNSFERDETWGGNDRHFCFDAKVSVPKSAAGQMLMLRLNTGATDIWNTDNPQIFVYLDGVLAAAMDMNHHELLLSRSAEAGRQYSVRFYAYSNYSQKTNFFFLDLYAVNAPAEKAYYDFKVPLEAALLLRDDDDRKTLLYEILLQTALRMDLRNGAEPDRANLEAACEYLAQMLEKNRREPVCEVYSVGHTHIDVAWKWPLRQTREKAARSFQTVLSLMQEYPEYLFMSSQPQLYQFVKEDRPELFAQIRQRVQEGRWEAEGAMWLEADCNLSSGESLVRQILYGKRFFREEFGCQDNVVLWLPDVFGYSAALPQIMQKSGIRYFMTTKLGWNDTNKFPYDTLYWEGIDGSRVLSHFITTADYRPYPELSRGKHSSTTYNGRENALQVMGTWQRYQNKQTSRKVLSCYGYGDGGGGTTRDMIEQGKRLEKGILDLPRAKFSTVRQFFADLEQEVQGREVPVWCGELYLEFHRGTYTSMAMVKQQNRSCEFLLQQTETLAALAQIAAGAAYPRAELEQGWKLLLLNQFHDILPGSSIEEVYTQAEADYHAVREICKKEMGKAFDALSGKLGVKPACDVQNADTVVVWNPLGFAGDCTLELPEEVAVKEGGERLQKTAQGTVLYRICDVPAKGFRKVPLCRVTEQEAEPSALAGGETISLETPFYQVQVASDGRIMRLYDKEQQRDLFAEGRPGNCFKIYDDRPNQFDCWNIDASYDLKCFATAPVKQARLVESGAFRKVVEVETAYRDSVIRQKIVFYMKDRRIDFETQVDWKEHQHLLKAEFPFALFARKVTADIQFGNVERPTHCNTSYEQAQFEMCAHKWVDCSENGYGAALLNDAKYGYSARESTVSLTLLKSGIFPNPNADIGLHTFTYSLYPHAGDFRESGVIQKAYELNCKPHVFFATNVETAAALPALELSRENIICETVKMAEDGEGLIVRMYEAYGRQTNAVWRYEALGKTVFECDLMEEIQQELPGVDGKVTVTFHPYEIKTFLVKSGS